MTRIVVTGLAEAIASMQGLSERRIAAIKATAATRTAVAAKAAVVREMPRVLDRPTPYTLGSVFVRPATAQQLVAEVYVKDDRAGSGTPAVKYLLPQVEGGTRRTKRFEVALRAAGALPAGHFIVPGAGARLDAYGNVSRGQIIQVLSQLRITLTAGYTRNMSLTDKRGAINAQRRAGGRFFVLKPGKAGGRAPGIYQREFMGRNVTPVFLFVPRVQYRQRLDFDGIVQRVVDTHLPAEVARAVSDSLARKLGGRLA